MSPLLLQAFIRHRFSSTFWIDLSFGNFILATLIDLFAVIVDMETVDVDTQVDVVFVFERPDNQKKIRVSSHGLSRASPVFKSMFAAGSFREGMDLAISASTEIPLPDDDPDAILTLLQVLHLRNYEVAADLKIERIVQIAKLVDRYDCAEAVRFSSQCWIKRHLYISDTATLHRLLVATYHFQHAECFGDVGSRLVTHSIGPIQAPSDGSEEEYPEPLLKALTCLEAHRKEASRLSACAVEKSLGVHRVKRGGTSCPNSESYIERRFAKLVEQFVRARLWPVTELHEQTLDDIITNMKTVRLEEPDLGSCNIMFCACNKKVSLSQTADQLKDEARSVEGFIADVCYYCMCGSKAVKDPGAKCEHKHSIA